MDPRTPSNISETLSGTLAGYMGTAVLISSVDTRMEFFKRNYFYQELERKGNK